MSVVFVASLRGWIQKNDIWPHQNKKVALYVPLVPVLTCIHLPSIASVLLNCRECREQGGFISVHKLRLFIFLFDHLNAKQYILFLCAEVWLLCASILLWVKYTSHSRNTVLKLLKWRFQTYTWSALGWTLFIQVVHMTLALWQLVHTICGHSNFSNTASCCSCTGSNEAKIQEQVHTPDSDMSWKSVKTLIFRILIWILGAVLSKSQQQRKKQTVQQLIAERCRDKL